MPELPEPITENKFPDCIAMSLHLKADSQAGWFFSFLNWINRRPNRSIPQDLDISLSVNFSGEQQIEIPGGKHLGFRGGRVTFGVRRGKFQLDLNNCHLHLDQLPLERSFKILMEIETQQKQEQADQNGRLTGSEIGGETIEKSTSETLPLNQKVLEEAPAWSFIFKAKGNGPLVGRALTETKLGRLELIESPCNIKATFRVRGEDIRLTWSKVGPTQNLARNKIAIIERALALRYIKPQLESCSLSEVSWRYG